MLSDEDEDDDEALVSVFSGFLVSEPLLDVLELDVERLSLR